MKQTEPNSLQRALAKGDAGPHPDADVLTAFSEGALLPREREVMLAHLAVCAECRDVLSVAVEPAVVAVKPLIVGRKERPMWRVAGPLLAAAALIALVTTVGIRYLLNRPAQNITVATKRAEMRPSASAGPPAPAPQADRSIEQKLSARKPAAPAASHPSVVAPLHAAPDVGAASYRAQTAETPRPTTAPPPAPELDFAQANAGLADSNAKQQAAPRPAAPVGSVATPKMESRAPAPASAFANTTTSRALAAASSASIARPRWRINDQGQPERAFGQGAWEAVPLNSSARMQVISVFGREVWVGGDKSQVFRSIDNGTTWRPVDLPEKGGTDHTIAHIRFDSAQEITIEAADGTTWSTTDGGAAWK